MVNESKAEIYKRIQSEYNKKLKEIEANLTSLHKELHQVEKEIKHEKKKSYGSSDLITLKAKKVELNVSILNLKKDIKKLNKEKIKKIKKLKKS